MADRFRTPRREKTWLTLPAIFGDLSSFGEIGGSRLDFSGPTTVIRMIGEYLITSRATLAAADQARVAVGIMKVTTVAAAVGIAALPGPASNPELPWLFWKEHAFRATGTGSDNGDQVNGISVRHAFDIKTMRKFAASTSLVFLTEAINVAGSPPMDISVAQTRVLFAVA